MIGTVVFDNPEVHEVAVILFFVYSMYRYYLIRPNPFKDFKNESKENLKHDKRFNLYVKAIGKETFEKKREKGEKKFTQIQGNQLSFLWNKSSQTFRESSGGMIVPVQAKWTGSSKITFFTKIKSSKFWLYTARTCLYKEDFWVILFPWILSLVAGVLIILKITYW